MNISRLKFGYLDLLPSGLLIAALLVARPVQAEWVLEKSLDSSFGVCWNSGESGPAYKALFSDSGAFSDFGIRLTHKIVCDRSGGTASNCKEVCFCTAWDSDKMECTTKTCDTYCECNCTKASNIEGCFSYSYPLPGSNWHAWGKVKPGYAVDFRIIDGPPFQLLGGGLCLPGSVGCGVPGAGQTWPVAGGGQTLYIRNVCNGGVIGNDFGTIYDSARDCAECKYIDIKRWVPSPQSISSGTFTPPPNRIY